MSTENLEKEITLKLTPYIIEMIETEARCLGITITELLRHVIGSRFGENATRISRITNVSPSSTSPFGIPVSEEPSRMEKLTAVVLAAQGAKCPHCTQQLYSKSILDSKCSSCGGEL